MSEMKDGDQWETKMPAYGHSQRCQSCDTVHGPTDDCAHGIDTVVCPFCKEDDFDLIGLKMHLVNGWCEKYRNTGDK